MMDSKYTKYPTNCGYCVGWDAAACSQLRAKDQGRVRPAGGHARQELTGAEASVIPNCAPSAAQPPVHLLANLMESDFRVSAGRGRYALNTRQDRHARAQRRREFLYGPCSSAREYP